MTAFADQALGAFRLGAPQHVHALTVFPIFGPPPRAEYAPFAAALEAGATVREVGEDGDVGSLALANPSAAAILLFEGEEIRGARQNRIFDESVLVEPGTELEVPVNCVEEGRWDDLRHEERFEAAPQVAYPTLRRALLAARLGTGGPRRPQHAVWAEIAAKSERMASSSETGAMHDLFDDRRGALDDIARAIVPQDEQVGAVVLLAGECLALDLVSRPDAWASLHPRLVQGYALDALEAQPVDAPDLAAAEAFVEAALTRPLGRQPAVGAGVRLQGLDERFLASGLLLDDELVQLSVFAA